MKKLKISKVKIILCLKIIWYDIEYCSTNKRFTNICDFASYCSFESNKFFGDCMIDINHAEGSFDYLSKIIKKRNIIIIKPKLC